MNKWLFFLLLAGLSTSWAQAQESKTFKTKTTAKKVVFLIEGTDLTIEEYNGSEVVIVTDDYEAPPERAKGLRPLYSGIDNTGIGLDVKEAGGELQIITASNESNEYTVKVPKGMHIVIEETGWDSGEIKVLGVTGELELKCKGSDIVLDDVSGPIVANTTSGDITVVFSKVNQNQPTSISNVSGFIDVSVPFDTKANFILKSISGEVYTDMELDFGDESTMRRTGGGKALNGKLNGGGVEINLKAISDDIYLRKKVKR